MPDMSAAILADIHSNATALMAVLEDIDRRGGADELWLLGDIVGYGPDPHRCIDILRHFTCFGVIGNHDLAALDKAPLNLFAPDAAEAIRWTIRQLSADDALFLSRLPERLERGSFIIVHGSPRRPVWEYLLSISIARENFATLSTPYCFVGHTHAALGFKKDPEGVSAIHLTENIGLALGKTPLILNPGSVGQPRDGDPRASYAIYYPEDGMFKLHRVVYDIAAVQDRMLKAGLPARLASRLAHGS
jgi:diadenosine tetraphosphatase ApaH/serine/threonine PP2A family protein phosphatase